MPVDQAQQQADRHPAHFLQRLTDGGQHRPRRPAQVDVVVPGHRQVLGHAQPARRRGLHRADGHLVVEPDDRGRPVGQVEQVQRRLVTALDRGVLTAQQFRRRDDADVGERGRVPGTAGVAGRPLVRAADHADPPVAQRDQMRGELAGPGEMRRGDGHHVGRRRGTRIHHHERRPDARAGRRVRVRFRRQDQDGAADVAVREFGEHRTALRRLAGVQDDRPTVQVEGLGDGRHDRAEIVGEQVRAAQEDGTAGHRRRRAAPSRSAAARTRSRVGAATLGWPLSARETVAMETPVSAAMSRTVARLAICYTRLFHSHHHRYGNEEEQGLDSDGCLECQ